MSCDFTEKISQMIDGELYVRVLLHNAVAVGVFVLEYETHAGPVRLAD